MCTTGIVAYAGHCLAQSIRCASYPALSMALVVPYSHKSHSVAYFQDTVWNTRVTLTIRIKIEKQPRHLSTKPGLQLAPHGKCYNNALLKCCSQYRAMNPGPARQRPSDSTIGATP
jgi:hypothetical protein